MYTLQKIAIILNAPIRKTSTITITTLLTDSRKLVHPESSLFFALNGPRRSGHLFIPNLYQSGLRYFVVSEKINVKQYPNAIFLIVKNVEAALQQLVAFHRTQFDMDVIGITGSNGKTIVKEWLFQLLQNHKKIIRSPQSYNSQIGVPLSVWELSQQYNLGIFEAGISTPGEMQKLAAIIRPTIGVLTNIGTAHSDGFRNNTEKLKEKLRLFEKAKIIIAHADDPLIKKEITKLKRPVFFWGTDQRCHLVVLSIKKKNTYTEIELSYKKEFFFIEIPFTDNASIENALTCCAVALCLNINTESITQYIKELHAVNMRLEYKKGINNCIIINDSYSADTYSLTIALHFLEQQAKGLKKTVILSDFLHAESNGIPLYKNILEQLQKHKINRLIGVGKQMQAIIPALISDKKCKIDYSIYADTQDLLQHLHHFHLKDEAILIKGARIFRFENIASAIEQKVHETILEINLSAITYNYKAFQQMVHPATKIMVMVKAFAYGSGGVEVASLLQYHKADYLGVAYADEGVELRKAGIHLPIMVLNPEEAAFDTITDHLLEPDIFSFEKLRAFEKHVRQSGLKQYPIHVEIETGMNRLGFRMSDVAALALQLQNNEYLKVQSVFSHLAASEDKVEDAFTLHQFDLLTDAIRTLKAAINYPFLTHISNSSGIIRFPQLQLDMVRLGIGLYGIAPFKNKILQPAFTLKTTIAQLKPIKKGETISYNRRGIALQDSVIATVRIGYADGYSRRLGNGVGYMLVKNKKAPVIGTVCMDMTMIDVSKIKGVQEGDEVIVFGNGLSVEVLAHSIGTIPYEIMTGISQRVKRVYWSE